MPAEALEDRAKETPTHSGGGRPESRCGAPGGDPGPGGTGILGDPALFGVCAFLGTVTMLFVGMTSAYMVRRASADWRPLAPPAILWLNTGALLASSAALEVARRRFRGWDLPAARTWVAVTGLLGALFVAGQYGAWRALAAQGIFLASNPHSSFFYVLTGLHGLHLLGGLAWFAAVASRLRRMTLTPGEDGLRLFAVYWHFLAGLWVYLLLVLFVL
ncbi:MAG: cytochrome c oxidase subunit 3 [Acidobacteria bacterium]|nr:cytochrome c oxidase subunit 3 [Acidobacteriota bacterium]